MRTEESLSKTMIKESIGTKERFDENQWRSSKREFWGVVADNIGKAPKTMINIGCGYDDSFKQFQDMGHLFVNFDLVYEILEWLSSKSNARSTVAGDVKNLPFKESSFDCLASIDLIHHESEQLEQLLTSFHRLLRPGGMLFLEDVNAWGMFQFPKSILLPKVLHRNLRSFYHNELLHSEHQPADYEFPTNPFKVKKTLERIGFVGILFFRNHSYPTRHEKFYRFYTFFSDNDRIAKYHNYHYMLMAKKAS